MNSIEIRPMTSDDSEKVLGIYTMGILTGNATFEIAVPTWEEFDRNHHKHSRFVAAEKGKVLGWAAISPVSGRSAYRGVAEVSVYVDLSNLGKGIGSLLMNKIIESSEEEGIWTLFSSVFPENTASVKLHEKHGFRLIGKREKISRIAGQWRDTLIFERRSSKKEFN